MLGADLVGRKLGIIAWDVLAKLPPSVVARLGYESALHVAISQRIATEMEAERVELDQLLRESDFISLHTDLNDKTRHLIGRRELSLMKPTSVLINTSRGGVLDQDALVQALQTRRIFAAGLDVTDPEPLPASHPLLKLDNCIVLPHIASATRDTATPWPIFASTICLPVSMASRCGPL